jgi:hypothetical protein
MMEIQMPSVLMVIDEFVVSILDRPGMYASSPESLEESLLILEGLRDRISMHCFKEERMPTLMNYLVDRGFGAMNLCQVFDKDESLAVNGIDGKYKFIITIWRDYLRSIHRGEP